MNGMKVLGALCSLVMGLMIAGCSDSAGPVDTTGAIGTAAGKGDVAVTMQAEMTSSRVRDVGRKLYDNTILAGEVADSMSVDRMRILVSALKLHAAAGDAAAGDRTLKVGPILLTVDSSGARTFTTATVPAGTYDRLKFEFHRLSGSETGSYRNDTAFSGFVTGDRSTFIIEGTVYSGGRAYPYTYRSSATANLALRFDPAIDLHAGAQNVIVLVVDPAMMFRSGDRVLDPRDEGNRNRIDNAIRSAVRALKRG